jgi:hypothetical protein
MRVVPQWCFVVTQRSASRQNTATSTHVDPRLNEVFKAGPGNLGMLAVQRTLEVVRSEVRERLIGVNVV